MRATEYVPFLLTMSLSRSSTFNQGFQPKMHKSLSVQSRRLSEYCENDRLLQLGAASSNSGRRTPPASKRLMANSAMSLDKAGIEQVPPPLPMSSHPVLLRQQEAKMVSQSHQPPSRPQAPQPPPHPVRTRPVWSSNESLPSKSLGKSSNTSITSNTSVFSSHYDVPPFRKPGSYVDMDINSVTGSNGFYQVPPPQAQTAATTSHGLADRLPPALPPKPPVLPPKVSSSIGSGTCSAPRMSPIPRSPTFKQYSTDDYNIVSESMSLSSLTEDHRCEFPLQVRVSAGFFGSSERETFSDGDLLNVHCLKQVKLVVLESLKGRKVKVPLNSGLLFGLLFNPKHNAKEAVNGYEYETIGDIIRLSKMPLLVCATKHYKGSNVDSSVQENEILIVNEVKPGRFKQNLVCTQIGSGKQKRLSENCAAHFTTSPECLKMFLPEIINYFSLPQMAVVYYPERQLRLDTMDEKENFPLLHAEVVRIISIEVEKTILATSALVEVPEEELVLRGLTTPSLSGGGRQSPVMFDIPINLPIMEVQIVEPHESECEKLYDDTRMLIESFDLANARNHVRIGAEDDIYYTVVRDDEDKTGIEFITSEAIYSKRASITSADGGSALVELGVPGNQQPLTTQGSQMPLAQPPISLSQFPRPQPTAFTKPFAAKGLQPEAQEPLVAAVGHSSSQLATTQQSTVEEIDDYIYSDPKLENREGSPLYMMVQKMQQIDESKQKQLQKLEKEVADLRSNLQNIQQLCSDMAQQLSGMSARR